MLLLARLGVFIMTISMYQASVPSLIRVLTNLSDILRKGEAYAATKAIDPTVLVNSRLYPDMFPLSRQVQIASDTARRGVARLAGIDAPKVDDTETTFPELIDRLQQTIAYLETFTADQIDGTEENDIVVPVGRGETMTMQGWTYLSNIVLPNIYYHVTTD